MTETKKHKVKISKHKFKVFVPPVKMWIMIFCFVIMIFLGVGYAQITSTLDTEGAIGSIAQDGLFITNVSVAATNGSSSSQNIKTYYSTLLTNYIFLDANGSSYIIYKIDVINKNNNAYILSSLTYDTTSALDTYTNEYIVPSILTVAEASALGLPTTNIISTGDSVVAGGTASFYVKYAYDPAIISGGMVASNYQTLSNGVVNYVFGIDSGGGGSGTPDDPYIDDTTVAYDPSNVPAGATTEYQSVEGRPKVTADANGNITAFEYQDTSGVTFSNGKTLDTGVVPFNGNILRIHLVVDMAVTSNENEGKYVLAALQKVGTQGSSNLYGGFIWFFRKTNEFDMYGHQSATIKSGWFGSSVYQIKITASSSVQTYTMDLEYDSANRRVNSFVVKQGNTTKTQTPKSSGYLPNSPFDATIYLGGIGVEDDHSRDVSNMVVKEFSVTTTDN
ncbi:hypothetical protein IKF88_01810 [Candidatus Saccharibacteria bacterium]|nr:hypothetical protein [Candidatus Saccharibacteria bacterium]